MIKISVITAVFNSKNTVAQAVDSVLSQSHPSVETIVIDGASTDGTLAVLEGYRARLGVFVSEKDYGIYDALNKGIRCASGDVIGFLHSDDVFENDQVLSKIAAVFEDDSIDAVYGDLVYVRRDDLSHVVRYWKSGLYDNYALSRGWMPPHPTFYVRRSVYEIFGGFDTKYRIAADYDTILRFLAVKRIRAAYIPEVLIRMRSGGISNRSFVTIISKSIEDIRVLRNNRVGGIFSLILKNYLKLNQFWRH